MTSHWSLLSLRILAVLATLIALFQMFTGFGWVDGFAMHARTAEIMTVLTLLAAIVAFVWSRRTGDKGLFWHAVGMTILGVIQIALGHMDLRLVHQIVGVVYVLGIVALATLSFRKPGAAVHTTDHHRVDPGNADRV